MEYILDTQITNCKLLMCFTETKFEDVLVRGKDFAALAKLIPHKTATNIWTCRLVHKPSILLNHDMAK